MNILLAALRFFGLHWRMMLALALAVFLLKTVAAREAAEERVVEVEQELAAVREELRVAKINEQVRAEYERKLKADSGAVRRVVRRIERVCGNEGVHVPGTPGVANEAQPDLGDVARDRDFARRLGRDLATCQAELRRADALREWIRGVKDGR